MKNNEKINKLNEMNENEWKMNENEWKWMKMNEKWMKMKWNENNSQKIIAGSESTLGIIVQAKLRIFDIPKKRQLTVVGFNRLEDALYLVPYILRLNPSSLEFVDETVIKNIPHKFKDKPKCLLMIEFDANVSKSQKWNSQKNSFVENRKNTGGIWFDVQKNLTIARSGRKNGA